MRKGDPNMLLTLALYIALSNLINKYLKEGYEDWAQKYQILSFIYPTHHHRQRHGGMSCPVNWLTCSPSLNYHRIEIFPSSDYVQSEVLLYPMYVLWWCHRLVRNFSLWCHYAGSSLLCFHAVCFIWKVEMRMLHSSYCYCYFSLFNFYYSFTSSTK